MKTLLSLISLVFISCGMQSGWDSVETPDIEVTTYLRSFEADAYKYGKRNEYSPTFLKKIYFVDALKGDLNGFCHQTFVDIMKTNYIVISRQHWYFMDSAKRKALIYHELVHCTRQIDFSDHLVAISGDLMEYTHELMFGYMDAGYDYTDTLEEKIKNLFNRYTPEGFKWVPEANIKL
jgi:hypothetical protein